MKKKFKLEDLDCANCAAKMEDAINKIDGVKEATVSFMTQRLIIEADDERFDQIMQEAAAVCRKVEDEDGDHRNRRRNGFRQVYVYQSVKRGVRGRCDGALS